MEKLIIASHNKNKIKEFAQIFKGVYQVESAYDYGFNDQIIENGNSLYENALIKAKAVCQALNMNALADDSGLFVNALNGEPGIYSARYSGENATDSTNNRLLLNNLKDKSDRSAKFKSCVVLYKTNGQIIVGNGEVSGRILSESQGENGFGYDPLFFCDELNTSFGLATDEQKNKVSHRGRAVQDLLKKL